ncbi:hypothetical protein D3C75_1109280 [compost metagenome]
MAEGDPQAVSDPLAGGGDFCGNFLSRRDVVYNVKQGCSKSHEMAWNTPVFGERRGVGNGCSPWVGVLILYLLLHKATRS